MSETIARVPRTEQEAAASYTRLSKWYDRFGGSEEPHIAEGLRLLNVQPSERVLEVGFGAGRSLIALAHAVGSTGQVIGIDLSPVMIAVARVHLQEALSCSNAVVGQPDGQMANHANDDNGFPSTIRGNDSAIAPVMLNRGSALHLPYAADPFDALFSSFMLYLIDSPDLPIVVGEMRRVLKPGGRAGLVSMSKARASNVSVKVDERFHRWLPKLIDCRPLYLQQAVEAAELGWGYV